MRTKPLLICGILGSILYLCADVVGGLIWQGYSHASQGVSELMAVGAPSRPLVLFVMTLRTLLLVVFAVGVWQAANGKLALRLTSSLLLADAVIGQITASFFPAPQRGSGGTATMHEIGTALESLCIVLAIGFGATAFARGFRLYSIGTILMLLIFGGLAASQIPQIEAEVPTPWLGFTERINIYAYLLWLAVLALVLFPRDIHLQRTGPLDV
jgi:hypothetical protein